MSAARPILKVRCVDRALAFYQRALGAEELWRWRHEADRPNPAYAAIRLLGVELHLSSFAGDGAFGTAVYVYVDSLAPALERLRQAAPEAIEFGPVDQPWRQRELYLRDPDNNQLRLGQPIQPPEGA